MNELGIPDRDLKEAVEKVRSSMLDALPDEKDCSHSFSPAFEQKMARLIRQTNARRRAMRLARRTAAVFVVMVLSISVWLTVDVSARAAAHNWFTWPLGGGIVYSSDARVLNRELPEYTLKWLPEGYAYARTVEEKSDKTAFIRSRAVFYYNARTSELIDFQYGALDERTQHQIPVSQKSHTRGKIVLGNALADLYVPLDAAESHYLFWADEAQGIFFSIKAHAETSVILNIAQGISLAETTN